MTLKEKIKLLWGRSELFILLKLGKVVKRKNECYQTPKWISSLFKFYYYSGIIFLIFFLIFLFISPLINELYIRMIVTSFLYILIECIFFIIIPIHNVKCWKVY